MSFVEDGRLFTGEMRNVGHSSGLTVCRYV